MSSTPPPSSAEPARRIGAQTAAMLVVACMIGTGVFTTTGFMVADLGSPIAILIAWLIGGLIAFCGAASYAELGVVMPRSGAEYTMLGRIYHPAVGFAFGWTSMIVGFAAPIAASAIAFGHYLEAAIPGTSSTAAAMTMIVLLSFLHGARVDLGSAWQDVLTWIKIGLIVLFCAGGLFLGDASRIAAESTPVLTAMTTPSFAISLIYVSYAYSGWNAAAYVAGEVRDPSKSLPRALLAGTSIVMVLYVTLNVVFLSSAPPGALAGVVEVGAVAATHLFGAEAGRALALVIAAGLVSNLGAMIMTGARVSSTMGEDYPRIRFLARRTSGDAPVIAVALQAVLALLMVLTASFDTLLTYVGFTLSVATGLTVLGVIVLRRRAPRLLREYRAFGYPWAPLLYVVVTIWIVVQTLRERPLTGLVGLATIGAGLALYKAVRGQGQEPVEDPARRRP